MRLPLLISTAVALGVGSAATSAQELVELYHARLSDQDHFNSQGQRLTDPAAIIRQDRANYHKFGKRDPEDSADEFYASKQNRALLEDMMRRGKVDENVRNAIVNGTPLITVKVYKRHIEVHLR